ncbi:MAG: hypothetical protein E7434_08090 [Ruminococcaceae bacterium]|nr:hypothetical protein [Oscillospiraceae bacterium]
MLHIDEKFKDNSPVKTVENIQSMLRKHGFDVEEKWFETGIEHCHSVTVTIAGTKLSAHGKGVSRELARASGHAELMERLQSGYRGAGGLAFTDMRQMTREELLQENRPYFERMAQFLNRTENVNFTAEDLAECSLGFGAVQACKTVPFFNAETGEKAYIPYQLLRSLYGTNGLAAGNSTAEAIVQGFSEIVERYCQRYFLEGKLTPPDVPEDYLAQFKTAYSVIEQVRAAGYMVIIKDCSMGDGYPVVASAIVNRKERSCRIMFGASPVFEIALERSLTEAFQGCAIKAMPFVKGFYVGKKRSADDIESAFTRGHANYPLEFFAEKASYDFKPFEDRSNLTNLDLVAYILRYLKKKDRTLLIRDLSHLGFHTYRLLVPGMSELHTYSFAGDPSYYRLNMQIKNVRSDLRKANTDELNAYKKTYCMQPTLVGDVPKFSEMTKIPLQLEPQQDRFLTLMSLAYAHWETGDRQQAYECLKTAQPYANITLREYVACLSQMVEMLVKGYSHEEAARLMSRFYDIRLLVTAQVNCANDNPFANFLISCNRECKDCRYANACAYPVNQSVTDRVNAAVAVFDNDAAFENLRNCIEIAKEKN